MKKESILNAFYRFFDVLLLLFLVFDFGYNVNDSYKSHKIIGLIVLTVILLGFNLIKYFFYKTKHKKRITLGNIVIVGTLLFVSGIVALVNKDSYYLYTLQSIKPILEGGLLFYFLLRLMVIVRYIYALYYNPAIMFVGSFFVITLSGAFLLLLPKATTHSITFTDALFTATSAVCVTGLNVLNTANDFTIIGQTIILILIQLGGLGILTFTSFFAFFFKGSSSFKEGLNVKDFIASDSMKDVLKTAMNVVTFTLSVELIGAIFIYYTTDHITLISDKIFFSIFHSVSAFCNAGFSTFSDNLHEESVRFDYGLQWIIMSLIVFGGLGYNIAYNFYESIKRRCMKIMHLKPLEIRERIITLNTKIIIYTTIILLVSGFIVMYIGEYNHTLVEHTTLFGKITTAAFNSVTPRTAGFGTVNFQEMAAPSILFMIFLMWVGASPASTGGGIKTSTFALATLNIFAVARGKNKIEIGGRQISSESTKRAFAIICISLIVIGSAIMMLLVFEPEGTDLLTVAFECFSAYSTVGLSMNFTPLMTEPSKYTIIIVMFVGRIGMLNLMIGLMRQMNHQFYQYPKENILIN
ncbi:TrkH family potassium uptake protein [Flavobacterium sp. '19STA2R22 D10 B1']|uniref:TrkH family potassium uptake protein n=1 Tax=Flavobacterium aerium TaxID=3037261 RepID=UPI00278C5FE8|nr:potassium transporter TrkG [Flavobacterium sp. '19STA2R22 D10 B1']